MVLVIVALVSSLLLQGLGFGLSLYERVHTRSESAKKEVLQREWFRQVNEALIAKPASAGLSLVGDSDSYLTETMAPLFGTPGLRQQISWKLVDEGLWYEESGYSIRIMRASGVAGFRYRDRRGGWHSEWPREEDVQNLPKAIAIEDANGHWIVAPLKSRDIPDLLLEDSRRERE